MREKMDDYTKQLETALETYQHLLDESQEVCDNYEANITEIYKSVKSCSICLEECLKVIEDPDERSDRYLNHLDSLSYSIGMLHEILIDLTDIVGDIGEKDGI